MDIPFYGLIFLASSALIYFGAEFFIRGSSRLAQALRISPFVIGVTFVAFGTSLPELVVSLIATVEGHPDLAIGNLVGSNISNIGLVLGIAAVLAPLAIHEHTFKFDLPFNLGSGFALLIIALDGTISTFESVILLIIFTAFLIYYTRIALEQNRSEIDEMLEEDAEQVQVLPNIFMAVAGLAALIFGAELFLNSAEFFAELIGVSEAIIGFTLVAIGTSLPELMTTIMAVAKREMEIGVGNILGSNVFNIAFVLGILGVLNPLEAPAGLSLSIYVMIGMMIFLFPLMKSGKILQRIEGGFLLVSYAFYVVLLLLVLSDL